MRRANAIITAALLILFLFHAIFGGMVLFGMIKGGSRIFSFLSWAMAFLIACHVAISAKMTFDTLRAEKKAGVSYPGANRLFWIRRVSGTAVFVFMILHFLIFNGRTMNGVYLLSFFGPPELVTQILLVVSLIVHLLTNITPLRIAFGLSDQGGLKTDILLILAVILLFTGAAFVVYFIRWLAV